MMKSPKILSLFSGCGGLDFGFRQAGFTNVLSIDIENTALAVHQENLDCPVQQLDLSTENPAFNSKDGIDVLLAGSPCQGFSTGGIGGFQASCRLSVAFMRRFLIQHYSPVDGPLLRQVFQDSSAPPGSAASFG